MTTEQTFGGSPELLDLYAAYTAGPDSIGSHVSAMAAQLSSPDPLLVTTATDLVLYPGSGQPPQVLGFRKSTRGFKELAGVSHLGPALASLVALREGDHDWTTDAKRLFAAAQDARAANSTALWRDRIGVEAYRGREEAIARMVDYSLGLTTQWLEAVLDDPQRLTYQHLVAEILQDRPDLPVSLDRVMVATFYLVGLDISYRLGTWLSGLGIDWSRAMVIVAGQQGRPTAGVTWQTNSIARIILATADGALPLERLYVAPHAPTLPPVSAGQGQQEEVVALEQTYRRLWAGTRAVVQLGGAMFPASPPYDPAGSDAVNAPGAVDWSALIGRLRLVMEDPRQLLSGAVTDIAARDLLAAGGDPQRVRVPGLDQEPYP
ncbi:DUF5624 domain-containing protein [Branchiibius sp. NY16-3462-2]|uniref:DUF5624 domain-containing protein n=1 Tax=Branchiibius sp. NY16-3462-2 TaxID=1807500 RepID=UPI0007979F82|nr:DUF5624 domain-containing protein [Branchiibius sp. NY16-3462-2]KYH44935.1 hypothetical protein AZH51_13600 [Branchiibius sp. NY16-3462-2]